MQVRTWGRQQPAYRKSIDVVPENHFALLHGCTQNALPPASTTSHPTVRWLGKSKAKSCMQGHLACQHACISRVCVWTHFQLHADTLAQPKGEQRRLGSIFVTRVEEVRGRNKGMHLPGACAAGAGLCGAAGAACVVRGERGKLQSRQLPVLRAL
jgi:hypothetical protein